MAEVDKAFYDSYRDSAGKLDSRLVDPKTGKPRKLTMDPADSQFRKEWSKIRKHLQEQKNCAAASGGTSTTSPVTTTCSSTKKKPDNPPYEPSKWKAPVENGTNCYAYAMNDSTTHANNKTAQPGKAAGKPMSSLKCPDITTAVLEDGKKNDKDKKTKDTILVAEQCPYQKKNKLPPPDRKGYYLVALVTGSKPTGYDSSDNVFYRQDYHWYRQDDDGKWSHKPGTTPVTRDDSSGNPVTNPEKCDRRTKIGKTIVVPYKGYKDVVIDYDTFCGYFYVKKGGASVKP
ncbi:hypothetical protein PN36_29080 [Candidatus Thiomargarita nelsonii]|uniref:Uncharacterized protein n=1 Tax=Candidatus Thiomargarita nelsonii TaxID=1003181 RepID=A0A0A6P5A7_9GAMM|nr:hypothetical protein PN36_29080 [Candidatus Thiomargarita nelsonii]